MCLVQLNALYKGYRYLTALELRDKKIAMSGGLPEELARQINHTHSPSFYRELPCALNRLDTSDLMLIDDRVAVLDPS